MKILICNVGSTSLKYQLFNMEQGEMVLASGGAERVGTTKSEFYWKNHEHDQDGREIIPFPTHKEAISRMLTALLDGVIATLAEIDSVGFKVVLAKGVTGVQYLTEDVLQAMADFNCVAPAHNPPYIAAIRQFKELMPNTPMIGSFETAVHKDMPPEASLYPIPAQLAPRTLARVGTQQGKIYGVPHTYSLQLLYYRKDFFENADLAAAFFAQYQVPLAPPKSWHMFQIISQFFTQQHHAASPCPYGTTVYTGVCPSALCCDLYPRMTAYNGGIFDTRGQVRLYRAENLKAYQSLLDCLPSAISQKKEYLHLDNMQLLLSGQIAMCVAFSNNAGFLLDNSDIALRNQIGFAPIPEQQPVVSGWCTAIHAQSDQQAQAWDFVQWLSEMEIASAYTILGGASPMTSLLAQQSLVQMYPWNTLAQQEYHTGVVRAIPAVRGVPMLDFAGVVEPILAEVVHQTLAGRMPLKMALLGAHQKLCDYAEGCGYPKNTAVDDDRWKERYV